MPPPHQALSNERDDALSPQAKNTERTQRILAFQWFNLNQCIVGEVCARE
jgi:hypothetical protein